MQMLKHDSSFSYTPHAGDYLDKIGFPGGVIEDLQIVLSIISKIFEIICNHKNFSKKLENLRHFRANCSDTALS